VPRRPSPWLLVAVAILGCGRLGFEPLGRQSGPPDGGAPGDGGPGARDGGPGDPVDAGEAGDAGDAGAGPDAGPESCTALDPDTVFLFDFEDLSGAVLRDRTGDHDGTLTPPVEAVPGPPGCGQAWRAGGLVHGSVPDDPAFQLSQGSLDFWVRVDEASSGRRGILSRDSTGRDDGHFAVLLDSSEEIRVRLQLEARQVVRCVPFPGVGVWFHLGINFGPPDLEVLVDGRDVQLPGGPCNNPMDTGIAGNTNRWAFGADNIQTGAGGEQVGDHFEGALDEIRLSRVRRDFTRP